MKLPAPVLLASVFLCAGLSADQALFRNSAIGYGGGLLLDMKTADVNHDGKQDVILFQAATPSQSACSIITMFGNGDGTFRAPVKTPIASCGSIAAGDLDSDGNLDVVLSGYNRLLDVYQGNRDGSFTLRSTKTRTSSITYSAPNLLLTDLNGDGKLDLITPAGKLTETFRGNGDGTFADGVIQPDFVNALTDIVAGDFNGDGRTDMVVTSGEGGSGWPTSYGRQSLITGKGDGNFNAAAVLSTQGALVAAGDFNGDLKTDYVAMGAANGFAFVHMGKGDGTFTTGATYITGVITRALSVDLDGDGNLDIVAAGKGIVTVMRGNGDGTFVITPYVASSSFAYLYGVSTTFVVADFDGDHHPDVLAETDTTLTFFHGNGDGSLAGYRKTFLETIDTAGAEVGIYLRESLKGLGVADFNGDGKPDLVAMTDGIIIMLNRGDGGFGSPKPLEAAASAGVPLDSVGPIAFATGDVNRDGKADIVVMGKRANPGTEGGYTWQLLTYLGNGDGTFHTSRPTTLVDFFTDLTLHDMNGDGSPDVILTFPILQSRPARLLFSRGDGTFGSPIVLPGSPEQIADFNGDGLADFAGPVSYYDGDVIFRNDGNGKFTDMGGFFNRRPIAVGDFNHDGKTDIVEVSYSYTDEVPTRIRLGKGDATFADQPDFTVRGIRSKYATKTVTGDFDGDGNLDVAFEHQVMLGKGDGTFRAIVPCVVARREPLTGSDPIPQIELAAADIDGNGSDDLLLLDTENVAVSTLLTRTTAAGTTPLSLTATTSSSNLHAGESVVVTVASSTSSMNVPSGGIRIDDNGVFANFATWKDGSASMAVAAPSVGRHTFTASYLGDDVFAAASAAVTQTVVMLDTQLALRLSPSTPQVKGLTYISADVFPKQTSTTLAHGTVTIREGDTVLFTGPYHTDNNFPGYNNATSFSYRFPTIGTHTLTLDYSGDANFPAGSITVAVPVAKAFGAVLLTTSPDTLEAGKRLTVQARVTAYHNLSCCEENIDGGTVTFRDRNAVIGTVPLVRGYASVTILPAAGYHSFTATYEGNVYTDPVASESTDYIVDAVPCAPTSNCSRRRAVH